MSSIDLDLDAVLSFAKQLARDVGAMMKDGQERRMRADAISEEEKHENSVDLVTEVDTAVEAYIREKIATAFPAHKFIGEETYDGEPLTDEPTWIDLWPMNIQYTSSHSLQLSPIDGTANFVHTHPDCCTSIGLAIGGVPVIGVIYNPFLDHIHYAAKGRGAFFNDLPLPLYGKARPLPAISKAMIMVDCASRRKPSGLIPKFQNYVKLAARVEEGGKHVHGLRIAGSACMSIAMVARGAVDMYAEIGARSWDVCAGICILSEAGGVVFGSKHADSMDGKVDGDLLFGRKFLFIRNIYPIDGETGLEAQRRIADEYWSVAEDYDP